jgi:hypothetical protein
LRAVIALRPMADADYRGMGYDFVDMLMRKPL